MSKELSPNIQDYLKRIYELTRDGGMATTSELADLMGISPASVTNMLQKLSVTDPPYLTYIKHQGVRLTAEGKRTALKILRRHRLLEEFLVAKLGYSWDEVHPEAEVLEHAMSPLLEERMDAVLGHPEFDPHGDPIPDSNLDIPSIQQSSLNNLEIGQGGQILRVPHEDPQVLRYLGKCGMRPGVDIKLLSRTPYDQTMRLLITETSEEVVIGPTLGEQITVRTAG
ncbi:MAG: metal-dependent transcriptional regulator [Anaerolineaceae bacterium]|nr:metal-dependent transcriptional regulator [Anaerolineaceae bacterium]